MKRTLTGPGGLTLVLDSAEIFPDDPGQGTPAMVHTPEGGDGTFWAALGEGELICGPEPVQLTLSQSNWLEQQEDTVAAFLEQNGG